MRRCERQCETMKRPNILPVFNEDERRELHRLLGSKVAFMMGRKFEEGDWTEVYCKAKGIPYTGWSNLKLDVVHGQDYATLFL